MTYCEDCKHMHSDSRKLPSYRAMCSKFRRLGGTGFVTKEYWDKDPPFMLCKDINGGACPIFQERKQEKTE